MLLVSCVFGAFSMWLDVLGLSWKTIRRVKILKIPKYNTKDLEEILPEVGDTGKITYNWTVENIRTFGKKCNAKYRSFKVYFSTFVQHPNHFSYFQVSNRKSSILFRKVRRAYQNSWDSRCKILLCCVDSGSGKGRVSSVKYCSYCNVIDNTYI